MDHLNEIKEKKKCKGIKLFFILEYFTNLNDKTFCKSKSELNLSDLFLRIDFANANNCHKYFAFSLKLVYSMYLMYAGWPHNLLLTTESISYTGCHHK